MAIWSSRATLQTPYAMPWPVEASSQVQDTSVCCSQPWLCDPNSWLSHTRRVSGAPGAMRSKNLTGIASGARSTTMTRRRGGPRPGQHTVQLTRPWQRPPLCMSWRAVCFLGNMTDIDCLRWAVRIHRAVERARPRTPDRIRRALGRFTQNERRAALRGAELLEAALCRALRCPTPSDAPATSTGRGAPTHRRDLR